jgi:hypothetical protein
VEEERINELLEMDYEEIWSRVWKFINAHLRATD